jgi:hypothetical protein
MKTLGSTANIVRTPNDRKKLSQRIEKFDFIEKIEKRLTQTFFSFVSKNYRYLRQTRKTLVSSVSLMSQMFRCVVTIFSVVCHKQIFPVPQPFLFFGVGRELIRIFKLNKIFRDPK